MSRNHLRNLIASFASHPGAGRQTSGTTKPARGRLTLEPLEQRQMMAGDVDLMLTDAASAQTPTLQSTETPEGEATNDLVQFARNLAAAGVEFFGAAWCPACIQQRQLFEDGGDDLPFIEVTNPDRTPNTIGIAEGITQYPTWRFPDDTEAVGVLSLQTISNRSGVPIPQSETPTFAAVGSQTVRIGSPLHIPIDAYDPDGQPLTTTISVADPSLIEATVLTGNRSLRLDMQGFGDMVFELFEQRAPVPAGRVADLADSGFYDGIIFHRVVNGFVIQAGDPTGTGTSGSNLGTFDDQFHPDLQHNRTGVLSFAKTTDDTNNSQFFITEGATRNLDFNHSIFGQLVEGEDVREAISNMETNPGPPNGGAPTTPIVIDQATVFTDTENSVIMLKAIGGTGSTDVTITVTDSDGNTHSEVVPVTIIDDTGFGTNSQPYLESIAEPTPVGADTTATLQLSSVDIEGDPVSYSAAVVTGQTANATASVDSSGLVSVVPAAGFTGTVDVRMAVQAASGASGDDQQVVTFTFQDQNVATPTGLDLISSSDSGSSSSDNITNEGSLTFTVTGVTAGNEVEIINTADNSVVGTGTATSDTIAITTNNISAQGDDTYTLAARQRSGNSVSGSSPTLVLTYDSTEPDSVLGSAILTGNVGTAYTANLISAEEGNGLVYQLTTAPTGATIDATTGVIEWTPSQSQGGDNDFTVSLRDVAGNVRSESFTVAVAETPVAGVRLEIADLDGNVVDNVATGEEFLLRMYGRDERSAFDRRGLFAAFADILFDSNLIRVVPGSNIEYAQNFNTVQSGTFGTGLIDELGAAQSNTVPTDEAESLIATVRFEALDGGSLNIISEPADLSGSEVLLYLTDDRIPAENVSYGSVTLAIDQNFAPVNDTFTVDEDTVGNVLDVLANDTAESGVTLSIASVTQPASGTVSIVGDELSFAPAADFFGTDTFTYTVTNGSGATDEATVTVNVTATNDPPVGNSDSFDVEQNASAVPLDVLANDTSGPDTGETLRITAVSASTAGATVEITGSGQGVNYTPPTDFSGADSFNYTLSDGTATTTVSVAVTVAPADDPPTAVDDSFGVDEDSAQVTFDILANDTRDGDNQEFTLTAVEAGSQGGIASIANDGTSLLYRPAPDFAGTETVRYTIQDTGGGTAVGTVTFTVAPLDDPPPSVDRSVAVVRSQGETLVLRLADLPDNVDAGETLRFTAVGTTTSGGTNRISSSEDEIFYTAPTSESVVNDSFTYTVTDNNGSTSQATLTINITDFEPRFIRLDSIGMISHFASGTVGNSTAIIPYRLTGTDELGNTVDTSFDVDAEGQLAVEVLPGTYEVSIPAVPFLQNGDAPRQIPVTSLPDDGDARVEAGFGRLRPEFISVRDWLGSAPRQTLMAAVAPGQTPVFMTSSSATGEVEQPVVALDAAGERLTIRGVDDQDAAIEAELPVDSGAVQSRGQIGDLRLYKISVEPSDVSFAASTSSAAAASAPLLLDSTPASAEVQSSATQLMLSADAQPEGEAAMVNGITVVDVVQPDVRDDRENLVSDGIEGELNVDSSSSSPPPRSVDEVMPAVAPELTIISSVGDEIASANAHGGIDESAVDELLGDAS